MMPEGQRLASDYFLDQQYGRPIVKSKNPRRIEIYGVAHKAGSYWVARKSYWEESQTKAGLKKGDSFQQEGVGS
jgi:hypothetical protein